MGTITLSMIKTYKIKMIYTKIYVFQIKVIATYYIYYEQVNIGFSKMIGPGMLVSLKIQNKWEVSDPLVLWL